MNDIFLGHLKDGREFCIPKSAFPTHFHLIGGTGKGKTTAIHTMLHSLLRDHRDPAAFFIIDRMGNLSWELLLWLNSKFCPPYVKERVIYIEPAREDVVLGFNPLLYETEQHAYYKVQRATDIILRAWESVNIEAMPRLARWTFNAFYAAAQLGLTIADCVHLLMADHGLHARHFPGAESIPFRVLMVTPTAKRRDDLRTAIASKPGAALWRFVAQNDLRPESMLHEPVVYPCEGVGQPLIKKLEGGRE